MEKYVNSVGEIFLYKMAAGRTFSLSLSFMAISNERFNLRKLNLVQQ